MTPVQVVGTDFPKRLSKPQEGDIRVLLQRKHANIDRSSTWTLDGQHQIINLNTRLKHHSKKTFINIFSFLHHVPEMLTSHQMQFRVKSQVSSMVQPKQQHWRLKFITIVMLIEYIETSVEDIFCIWHQVCDNWRNSIIRGTHKK